MGFNPNPKPGLRNFARVPESRVGVGVNPGLGLEFNLNPNPGFWVGVNPNLAARVRVGFNPTRAPGLGVKVGVQLRPQPRVLALA